MDKFDIINFLIGVLLYACAFLIGGGQLVAYTFVLRIFTLIEIRAKDDWRAQ